MMLSDLGDLTAEFLTTAFKLKHKGLRLMGKKYPRLGTARSKNLFEKEKITFGTKAAGAL